MRRKQGFTLVELLVVMAIISILAAIAIPNIQSYIARGRATQAISEIQNIELAITKLLSDAGRSSLNDVLNLEVIGDSVGINSASSKDVRDMSTWTAGDFENFTDAYTNAVYRLLKKGRGATVSAIWARRTSPNWASTPGASSTRFSPAPGASPTARTSSASICPQPVRPRWCPVRARLC